MIRAVALWLCLATPLFAAEVGVPVGDGLANAIAGAKPGDVLILAPGLHPGPVVIDKPLTLDGLGKARIDAGGHGSVIKVTGEDVVIRGLTLTGSGSSHQDIDSGVQMTREARRVLVENNRIEGNLYG
ncbi:MAG TPA: nitrous oxide reductase family maturation protein NosD, partial [Paracoccus sp. (in: a-proteobacteria)]|nr:nitrous oxide reductase family maturation protein NosD [Paracoccus sp. (in: a-proteobacteria)]